MRLFQKILRTRYKVNNQYHEELLKNQEAQNIVENISDENETSFSQEAISSPEIEKEPTSDLKEFGGNTDEPDLFSSDNETSDLLGSNEQDQEEDDLEIPAFLRRQKLMVFEKINGAIWYRIRQNIIRYCLMNN